MRSCRALRTLVPAAVAVAVLATATAARAQTAGNIDLNVFRPAMDSRGYITVNASQPLGHLDFSFGLGALDWGYRLLRFEEGEGDGERVYSIDNLITGTLIAAVGLKLGPIELEPGISVPIGIMAGDRDPDSTGDPNTPNDDENYELESQGLGNVGLHLKTRFLKTSRGPKIGLGVIASVYLPTATEDGWLGESQLVPQIMGILDKEFGRERRFRMSINGGIRLRSDTETFVDQDTSDTGVMPTGQRMSAGSEIPFGLGIAYAIRPQKFDVVAEVFGAYPLDGDENYQPLEAILGAKVYLARNSFLSIGGGMGLLPDEGANPDARAFIGIVFEPNIGDRDGDGLKDDVDECPAVPEDFDDFEDEDGCPEADNDRDGILDVDDLCPNEAEDKDGFEDEDGCPDLDNDKDRIKDVDDRCPNEPETYNGVEDQDGCPDRGRVVVTDTKIEILDKVYFEYNKAKIKSESFPILDAVAATLEGNPDIQLIEIQGHTDERGNDEYNLQLSDKRAKAVMQYLADKGIDENRLTAQGYGETQPLDRKKNEEAYAKNRRVEFLILKRSND
jgi:OOP family OmpA-OmpF porin